MPAGKESEASASNAAQRTTFRPPWVKEGPNPLPVPAAPWTLNKTRRDSNKETPSENPLAGVQLRKTSVTAKEPQENGKENTFKLPQLRPVPPKEESKPPKEKLPPVKLNSVAERQQKEAARKPPIQKLPSKDEEIDRATPVTRNALVREESMRRLSQTPAPPPMPPPAPAMPGSANKKPLTEEQKERLEQLKNRPKVRPDWTAMLKEIESNKKLKHVECNDRSEPLLPQTKATEHFVFESEKPNVHNELLKQIQTGFNLKKVKTNDRSKPMLEGLRKFRRQMTIEEQIQKSVSMASMPPKLLQEEIEDQVDEMDDIDKVRDDLQSTKQMLALELRNKEAQIRENKRLLSRIQNLEAELEKERNKEKTNPLDKSTDASEKLIQNLKKEAEQARKSSEEVEKKFTDMTEQLDNTKFLLEETKKQNQLLEKKLLEALQGKRTSISKDNMINGDDDEDELFDVELSEESDGEDTEEKRERRAQRELKLLRNKLRNFKNKEDNAKKERVALREIMKKHQTAIKEEKKKYKALQKEVDKMAALMKDVDDEDEEEEEEKEESDEEVEEEEEESSEESESEESEDDSDSERSQSEAEDAPIEKKKDNLVARSTRHEKILGALKKGNFMLKTNAERLQDDLNKQKEMTASLQEDLDSVLAELG